MKRPVWLFSLDGEGSPSAPMTTGGLAAYFSKHGRTRERTEIELVHFFGADRIDPWFSDRWRPLLAERARAGAAGSGPVLGFSFYTWNAAEFLALVGRLKADCPGALVVAGGPHVQSAEDFLFQAGIDVVVLGEGEITFQQLLDCPDRAGWPQIAGLAYPAASGIHRTAPRERVRQLDVLTSALDLIPLRDADGKPLYKGICFETSRGCPYCCAFCGWNSGGVGGKIARLSPERIRADLEKIGEGGIQDIWICDSNWGALKQDLATAETLVQIKKRTGLPSMIGASWDKRHGKRTQQIARLLHRHGMLQNYNLALQTLTPLALELSHRTNMETEQYRTLAKTMSESGVPVAAELIWGLPGDNLPEFEANLDRLAALFPNINIFGYTLLPGTEFYRLRDRYGIEAVPIAGYGRVKGEYVVGCHSFDREQGFEGYFLITAYILLVRGYLMSLTARLLALKGGVALSQLLRAVLRGLLPQLGGELPGLDAGDRMAVYENRSQLYLCALGNLDTTYKVLERVVGGWLERGGYPAELVQQARLVLTIDRALCPRVGPGRVIERDFAFDADRVARSLERMEIPAIELFRGSRSTLRISHPGRAGEVLTDPDGGSWMCGTVLRPPVVNGYAGSSSRSCAPSSPAGATRSDR